MLRTFLKKTWLSFLTCAYALAAALFWLAMRPCWSGVSKFLGAEKNQSFFTMQLPLIVCIFLWLAFAYAVVFAFLKRDKRLYKIISLAVSFVFTIIFIVVIVMGALEYLFFVWPDFFRWLGISALIALFAAVMFLLPALNKKPALPIKCFLLAAVILTSVFAGFEIKFNSFTHGAVVYAVEDNYQIVFSTNSRSLAWVEAGGKKYYDTYAGSMKSTEKVHKIEIPQAALNSVRSYSIHAQKAVYRGPFGGYKGMEISESYDFRPVNTADGLQYYMMSDIHGALKGAENAAAFYRYQMDFIVIAGDVYSMIDSHYDANFVNLLAHNVTRGEFPVIYARGNHEVKGRFAEQLHKYVGSKDGNFYYTVRLADMFAVVLDLGEDHEDDWWEYYETAQYDTYRTEQTAFLRNIADETDFSAYNYKLAICHIPIAFVNNRKNHEAFKNEWTEILNEIEIDMCLSGHQHVLYPLIPTDLIAPKTALVYNPAYIGSTGTTYNGYLTDAAFPNLLVGKRSDAQLGADQTRAKSDYIGLYTKVDFTAKTQTSTYTNAQGDRVSVVHPFAGIDYGTELVTTLKTNS